VTAGRYALGAVSLLTLCAAIGFAAFRLRRRLLPDHSGALGVLAGAVIAMALLIGLLELLGLFGLMRLGPVLGGALALAGWQLLAGRPAQPPGFFASGRRSWMTILACIAALAVLAQWLVPTLISYDYGITSVDSLWYHLPWAASFAQTGSIVAPRFTDVEYLTAFYPATSEILHALGIVLIGRDTLSPLLNVAFVVLTMLAGWCIGLERGMAPVTMTATAVALALPMVRNSQAGTAANDIVGTAFLLAAVALYLSGPASPRCLAVAAVAAGLAVSVKLSLIAPVLALSAAAIVVPRGDVRGAAKVWLPPLVLAGGYWYARNIVVTGNPLPWVHLPGLPVPHAPLQSGTGYSVGHYVVAATGWKQWFEPGLIAGLGPWWPAIVAIAVLGPLACSWLAADDAARAVGAVAVASVIAYALLPETAAGPAGRPVAFSFNLRYAAPALALAFAITPLAGGVRARGPLLIGALALLVSCLSRSGMWPAGYATDAIGAALVAGAIVWLVRSGSVALSRTPAASRRWRWVRPVVAVGLMVTLLGAAGAAGYPGQRHYLQRRYSAPAGSSLAGLWQWFRGVHDARVALGGTFGSFFAYPLWGLDDSNRVQYIARRGPHGSFTPITTCSGWWAALESGRYRYVVTTPGRDPWHPTALLHSPESAWTARDPGAALVFWGSAGGRQLAVYELFGAPDRVCGAPAARVLANERGRRTHARRPRTA
jgi:hypothetical protein